MLAASLRTQWYNHSVHLVDLHATILDLAGIQPQQPVGVAAHDGVSLLPVLTLSIPLATPIRTGEFTSAPLRTVPVYTVIRAQPHLRLSHTDESLQR